MKKINILAILIITLVIGTTASASWWGNLFGKEQSLGATVFNSNQVGTSPVSGYYLKTNGTTSSWEAVSATGGSLPAQLGQIGDVSTSTLAYGHLLMYTGSVWQDTATSTLGLTVSETDPLSLHLTDWFATTTKANLVITKSQVSDFGSYEAPITAGTINDYWRGDKSWQATSTLRLTKSQITDFGTYENLLTFNYPLTRSVNAISVAISTSTLLSTTLNSGNIFVGNGSNIATGVALSGDAVLSNAGVLGVNKTRLNVRNETGSPIVSTKAVYISGFNNFPLISLADNTDELKHNVVGVTIAPINSSADGFIATNGQFDAETDAWTVGSELYMSTAGNLTTTEPTSGTVRHIGIVTVKANYPTGKILLYTQPEEYVIGMTATKDLNLRLGDSVGATRMYVKNYANSPVASIDSLGHASTTQLSATVLYGALTGNASTATALASDPGDCVANTWATNIAASGTLTCNAINYAGISAMTSANLAGIISDEVGTDKLVYNTAPTLVNPILGYASSTQLTVSSNFYLPALGTAAGSFLAVNGIGQIIATTTPTSSGVTSVDFSVPTGLSISGNPITTSGTLALTWTSGYAGVKTASTTNWNTFYDIPSNRIGAGRMEPSNERVF